MTSQRPDLLYRRIAATIEHQITSGTLNTGERLPSVREVCREHGVSMNTAVEAYRILERKGFITSRPKSGFFVSRIHRDLPPVPSTSDPITDFGATATEGLVARVFSELGTNQNVLLSLGVPAPELLPIAQLNKSILATTRALAASGTSYDLVQGSRALRRQIAKTAFSWEGKLHEDDLVTTAGCTSAIAFALMTVTKPGDIIVTESPVYFGMLQLALQLGLHVRELPTNPVTGIDLDAFKKTLQTQKISACLLTSNFSNPMGACMPEEHKREVVRLIETYNIPLIEDDICADIYFTRHRPKSCKTFDESGLVLWCGSVSKTLAPGYRVGWIAPGRFTEAVIRTKLYHSISSTTLTQETVGHFLESGKYERHLRRLRDTLHANLLQYLRAIGDYFPDNIKVSRPQGNFVLWIELPTSVDGEELYTRALQHQISIAPGRMFTLRDQYRNCIRLSYGIPWSERIDQSLKILGQLIHQS